MVIRSGPRWQAVALFGALLMVGVDPLAAQLPPMNDVYQDFRGGRPLLPAFKMVGPDVDAVIKPEEKGLRIRLPATRDLNRPVEIATTSSLAGDFEFTVTYELLSALQPTKGYGVGVSLNVTKNRALEKRAWVARLMHPGKGSVYMSEYTDKPTKGYRRRSHPSDAMSGQLRLVRVGSKLVCLTSDGPGQEFIKINEVDDYGTDDLEFARCQVVDSGTPNAVDARLIDLRIRFGSITSDKAAAPAPLAPPAPVVQAAPEATEPKSASAGRLAAFLFLGLAIILLVALALAVGLYVRRRRAEPSLATAESVDEKATSIAVSSSVLTQCSACGKQLKVKAALAGKKVKCGQCGSVAPAPRADALKADRDLS